MGSQVEREAIVAFKIKYIHDPEEGDMKPINAILATLEDSCDPGRGAFCAQEGWINSVEYWRTESIYAPNHPKKERESNE